MEPYASWMQTSSIAVALQQQSAWLWPLSETLHFIGLALVIGVTGFFDLRLLGFMKRVPIPIIREFMPLAIFGFALNLVTGVLFFLAQPYQYAVSGAWWVKVGFLMVAGLNAMFFETTQGARVLSLAAGEETPLTFKIVGGVSLFAWFAVLYFGRMLPYLGQAY